MPNISSIVKNVRNIMRNEDQGISGDAQRLEQLGWMLFLKILDEKDQELELIREGYITVIPEKFQWHTWATDPEGEHGGVHQFLPPTSTTRQGCLEGERGGVHQFYTPKCVVNLIAEMIEPYKGKIYDPCCGAGPAAAGFVQSIKFVESHHRNTRDISVYGQEMTSTTYKLAKMNESAKLDEIITENLAELGFSKG